jgi:hypothetical protein
MCLRSLETTECLTLRMPEDKYSGFSRSVSPWSVSQLGLPGAMRIGRVGKLFLLIGAVAVIAVVIARLV